MEHYRPPGTRCVSKNGVRSSLLYPWEEDMSDKITALRARVAMLEEILDETLHAGWDELTIRERDRAQAALRGGEGRPTPPLSGGEEAMQPCPFCGASLVDIADRYFRHPTDGDCIVRGMVVSGEFEKRWNRRALSPPPQDGGSGESNSSPAVAAPRPPVASLSADLEEVLDAIKDFLRDQHDVVDGPSGPRPNLAMALHIDLQRALGETP